MKYSVAVCAYNASKTIAAVIDSILSQTLAPNELIIVNDGSTDETAKIASRFCDVKLISSPRNQGIASARNLALIEAKNEVVIFVDADAAPRHDCFENLLTHFDKQNVCAVSGQGEEFFKNDFVNYFRALYTPQSFGDLPISDAPMFLGLCFAIRKDIAKTVGEFDVKFKTNGEDVDLSFRLKKAGYKIFYEPKAVVDHLKYDSFFNTLSQAYRFGFWAMVASMKNGLSISWFLKPATKNLLGNGIDRLKRLKLKEASMFFVLYCARILGIFIGLLSKR